MIALVPVLIELNAVTTEVVGFVFGQEDVLGEPEAHVGLHPAAVSDNGTFAKGEDVVADDVFSAVVLVKDLSIGGVAEVVLDEEVAAAFVGVDAPCAVVHGGDVVDVIVADGTAGL